MEAFIAAAGTMLLVIGVTAALLQLFSAYALQTISEKNELPDFAQLLAWIPMLQIYPLVKCGGGDFKRFMLAIAGIVGGGVLLGILAAVLGDDAIVTVLALLFWAGVVLGSLYYFGRILWRTAEMRGVSGWIGLLGLLFFPFVYGYIAFHDGWGSPNKAGLAIGTLLAFGPLVGQYQMVNMMPQQMEQALQAEGMGEMEAELVNMMNSATGGMQIQQTPADQAAMEIQAKLAMVEASDPGDPQQLEMMQQNLEQIRDQIATNEPELDAKATMELHSLLREQQARLTPTGAESTPPAAPNPEIASAAPEPSGRPITAEAPYDELIGFAVPASPPCQPGTRLRGAAPPEGLKQWCTRMGPDEGMRQGWYTEWNENGSRALAGEYREGLRVGVWTRWFPNGVKRVQAEFRDGLQDGILVAWNQQGEKVVEQSFSQGSPVSR
jgi:hypothetical protein